jgi:hypothetical protein
MGHDYCHREEGLCHRGCPDCSKISEEEYSQNLLKEVFVPLNTKTLKEILDEKLPLEKRAGWQPMSTAPKDGRFIDLWHIESDRRYADCRWFTNSSGKTCWHLQQGGRAFNIGGDDKFSHWRNIPGKPN